MARQKGLIKIVGTVGDLNYYITKGVAYARRAGGGFNGDAIKTKASMVRVRENASEFGHCSQVKKAFRMGLLPFLQGITGRSIHSRLMQLFLEIKALDAVSERGKRCVQEGLQTGKGKRLLRQFEFTPHHALLQTLIDQSPFDWATQALTVMDFYPKAFKAPKTATHVGVTLGVLDFDFESLDASLHISPTHFLEIGAGANSFVLAPTVVVSPSATGIAALNMRYYEIIEDEVYGLESQVGAGILDVAVI